MKNFIKTNDITIKTIRIIKNNKSDLLKVFKEPCCLTKAGFTKTQQTIESYKSEKTFVASVIVKIHEKCDCIEGSMVIRLRHRVLIFFH